MSDLECGWNAGVKKSILVRTGHEPKFEGLEAHEVGQANVVKSLAEAAEWILAKKEPLP